MTKLSLLPLILTTSLLYGFNEKEDQTIELNFSQSTSNSNNEDKTNISDPSVENIIQALEKRILFCKTATKEQFAEYLGQSIERLNSISDEEFFEIREDNVYLYQNMINSITSGTTEIELVSRENNTYKYAFKEKGNGSFVMIMDFSYLEGSLLLE